MALKQDDRELVRLPKLRNTKNQNIGPQSVVDAYFTLPQEWLEAMDKWRSIPLECARCGEDYFECNNIGQWQCKQHVGQWNMTQNGKFYSIGRWDCCGDYNRENPPSGPTGCVKSDHSIMRSPYTRRDDMTVPNFLLQYIRVDGCALTNAKNENYKDPWTAHTLPGNSVIRRYDWIDAEERLTSGKTNRNKVCLNGDWVEKKYLSLYRLNE